jgi:hypothetical protein
VDRRFAILHHTEILCAVVKLKLPWLDPSANETGVRPNPPSAEALARYARACRGISSVLRESAPELFAAMCDFIEQCALDPQRDTFPGGEVWTLRFDSERMERWVCVRCWSASWFDGLEIEVATLAIWNKHMPEDPAHELISWSTSTGRWFGLTSDSSPELFTGTLRVAMDDARAYTPADLHQSPVGTEPKPASRPWRT